MNGRARLMGSSGEEIPAQVTLARSDLDAGVRIVPEVTVQSAARVDRLIVELDVVVDAFVEHGFQSWSTVRRCVPGDVRPERAEAPRWFRAEMLADRDGAGHELSGDTFLVHDGGVVGFLTQNHAFGRVCVSDGGRLEAQWLLDGVEFPENVAVTLDALWVATGDPGSLYSAYAELSGAAMGVRAPRPLPRAWCSWYQYFDQVTPADVRENLALAVDHGIGVIQIDDGFQREIGVWTKVNDRWGEPLGHLADEIRSSEATAGIWTAPFAAIDGGEVAREHPEWLVRNSRGEPTTALYHAGWGGKVFALDTTHPEVLEHLRSVFRELRDTGFDYFKIDFCHAGAAVGRRHDDTATRAQALRRGLEAVREGIGEDAYLLGCGCPLLSGVGVVDAMRVSEDVAPYWEPRLFFPGFEELTVSALNAVQASLLRAPLHRRWFALDPDCVLLRDSDSELTDDQRGFVMATALATSGFIVLSDSLALYGPRQWDRLAEIFDMVDDGPRELVDPFATPLEVTWDGGSARFDWEGHGAPVAS